MQKGIWALFVLGICFFRANAGIGVDRPSPQNRAEYVGGRPQLSWSAAGENLFNNGSFEEGALGWDLSARAHVFKPSQIKAAEGTNVVVSDIGSIQREVTLPAGLSTVWSFAVWGTFAPRIHCLILKTDQVVKRPDISLQGRITGWNYYAIDLSEFAGETVRLALNFASIDTGVYQYADDFRLTTFPTGAQFDVYLGTTYVAGIPQFNLLGRASAPSWPLRDLLPNRPYWWRVDTISDGSTNRGPVWEFNTGTPYNPSVLSFAALPDFVCAGKAIPVQVNLQDDLAFNVGGPTPQQYLLTAAAADGRAPGVVISEIDVDARDGVEIANASDSPVAMGNWMVQFMQNSSLPTQTVKLAPNAVLQAGEILTLIEAEPANAWPSLRISSINWADTSGSFIGGVILRDAASNVVDCVFFDGSNLSTVNRTASTAVGLHDWLTGWVTNRLATGGTFQRRGNRDSNSSSDWFAATRSMKEMNASMQVPFAPGYGVISGARWGSIASSHGVLKTTLEFPAPASKVDLYARTTNAPVVFGFLGGFDVVPHANCLTLFAAQETREDTGTFPVRIVLGETVFANQTVRVVSSNPVIIPSQEAVVAAGESEVTINLQVPNNALLEGSKTVTLRAEASGFPTDFATVKVWDDEKATLTLELPARVLEGFPGITLNAQPAPDRDVLLEIKFDEGLGGYGYFARLPAGSSRLAIYPVDDWVETGDVPLTMTVKFDNWTPVTGNFVKIDNDPSIYVNWRTDEGRLVLHFPTSPGFEFQPQYTTGDGLWHDWPTKYTSPDFGSAEFTVETEGPQKFFLIRRQRPVE